MKPNVVGNMIQIHLFFKSTIESVGHSLIYTYK